MSASDGVDSLPLAIALPVGVVVVIVFILVISFITARRSRQRRAAAAEAKTNVNWNEEQDEILDDREWVPLETGWRDPSQTRLSTISTSASTLSSSRLSGSHIDINNNGFAYRPPPPHMPPALLKGGTGPPMSERKKSGTSVNVPATIGERDESVKATF